EDYQFIYSKLSYVNQVLENLQLSIEQQANRLEEFLKSRRSGSSKEVMKQINATKEALDFKILKQLAEVRASLDAKSRALSHFSVAFMGKTKAGKSTLHAIITNEGWNAIGVGKQRTTRYNRIYEWKNIRIIDTPGIGAPGGQTDEEIAKSIIDESDVICYVVTNDSVQESEFQFLGLLEKHAKPLIVLMNIKNNLRDPRRLEIFLKQPEKLFARQGNNSLEGHFNRIREYVKNHYRNNSFEIVPVMLLAAQMSKEEKYHEIKEQLFKESRLQNFLDIIRESIIVNGVVRRSQTFLGSTVGNIEEPLRQINDEIHAYKHILKILQEKKERVYRDINFQKANSEQQLKVEISCIFQDIRSKIYPFALQNYKRDEKELTQGWNIIYNSSELSDKLEAAYRKTSEAYNNSISEILEEVGKEMQLIVRLNKSNSFGAISSDYDGFSLKIASRILAIAGTVMTIVFPITGFFLGIFGSVLGWFSGLFKSEDQKRREAISKICQSIEEQVDEQEKEIKHQAISSFHEQSRKVSDAVESYFSGLIQGIELIQESMEVTTRELEAIKQDVNLAYSARIINYCCGESKNSTEIEIDNPRKFIQSVARDFGSQIIIRLSPNFPVPSKVLRPEYQEKLSQILQEKITIEQAQEVNSNLIKCRSSSL
ncbi:MAG: GTPase, partial [Pseudanabaenaceae cyanobacterium]